MNKKFNVKHWMDGYMYEKYASKTKHSSALSGGVEIGYFTLNKQVLLLCVWDKKGIIGQQCRD